MTYEIPCSPRRAGMVCWQLRNERQPDGSYRLRREYAYPRDAPVIPPGLPPDPIPGDPAPFHETPPKVSRGVVPQQQELL